MASNFTQNLPNDILLDSGLLRITEVPFGISRGGLNFDPGKKMEQMKFDGQRSALAGFDRVIEFAPKITGKFIPFGTGSIPQLDAAGIGSFTASGAGSKSSGSYTPVSGSSYLSIAAGQYLTGLTLTFPRGAGGYASVVFPMALCTSYKIAGKDQSEAEIDATFEARLQLTGSVSTDQAPYYIELTDNLP
jgi:hypothetical protein